MIKAVLFDFGGVLVMGGRHGAMHRFLADFFGIDQSELQLDDLHKDFRRGAISDEVFFRELNHRHPGRAKIDAKTFVGNFDKLYLNRIKQLYTLAKALRDHGIKTGILSNIYGISAKWLYARGYYDEFHPIVLSCYENSAKPDLAIYHAALRKLSIPPNEVLFIDDQPKCLPPAQTLGMRTILAKSPDQIVADVLRLLKTENNLELAVQ